MKQDIALELHHDFSTRNEGYGKPNTGNPACEFEGAVMSYFPLGTMKKWSPCSVDNFRSHYATLTDYYNVNWCMDSKLLKITIKFVNHLVLAASGI